MASNMQKLGTVVDAEGLKTYADRILVRVQQIPTGIVYHNCGRIIDAGTKGVRLKIASHEYPLGPSAMPVFGAGEFYAVV